MSDCRWFVANDCGELAGHDMSEAEARWLVNYMTEQEPDAGWEALCSADEND